ncbi:hypothetical protein K502DRAFT_283540, partial [Neoconidiobolus thromboides FSU 785]
FQIVSQSLQYSRYLKLYSQTVHFPKQNKIIDYDIVGHNLKHQFIVCCVYHSATKTFTLIQEYSQGNNNLLFGFVSGGFDNKKHLDIDACVKAEVLEEVGYSDGKLVNLLDYFNNEKRNIGKESEGILEIKWGTNKFYPYLLIDPILSKKENERELDYEEYIKIIENITLEELEEYILNGKFYLPSTQTWFMVKKYLNL